MEYSLAGGALLIPVVMGIVEWSKSLGLSGRWLTVASLLIGLIGGITYRLSVSWPTDYAAWFGVVVYGLALGLAAAGVNDWAKQFRPQ
jgi:hypothetical protein